MNYRDCVLLCFIRNQVMNWKDQWGQCVLQDSTIQFYKECTLL